MQTITMKKQKIFHMAIASLVFSLISIISSYIAYISILIGIYAIFKIKNTPILKGKELAIAGITISIIVLIVKLFI